MLDNSRYIQIDDWCFEIKMIKAFRADQYGQPYSAIANCNIIGDQVYIDGLMTKDQESFTKEDANAFVKLCQKLGIDSVSYHRMKDGSAVLKQATDIIEEQAKLTIKKAS